MRAGPSSPAASADAAGYLHRDYAAALVEVGSPVELPASGAWVLERALPGAGLRDVMGCYPLFCCRDWNALEGDLLELGQRPELIALSAVTDPFAPVGPAVLERGFPDLVRIFKQHFVVDLRVAGAPALDAHHRRNVRKGLANATVTMVTDGDRCADALVRLYATLRARHRIRGWAAFSEQSLRAQLRVPGMVAFEARSGDAVLGLILWYVQGADAYYHLGAYSDEGYACRAAYALFSTAIRHFQEAALERLDLGAAAGLSDLESDGLARFKRGWATGTLPAYLCGRVFNRSAYAALTAAASATGSTYFPAYREREQA